MARQKNSLFPGIALIVVGLWLVSRRVLDWTPEWEYIYPVAMILIGGFLIWETFIRNRSKALFWGVVLLGLGAFFFLRNYDFIPYFYSDEYWPIFLIALCLGFFALFVMNPKDWGVLIPALILLFFGIGYGLRNLDGRFRGFERIVETYWPALLILIGLGVVLRGLPNKQDS